MTANRIYMLLENSRTCESWLYRDGQPILYRSATCFGTDPRLSVAELDEAKAMLETLLIARNSAKLLGQTL